LEAFMNLPEPKSDQFRTTDEWERAWPRHWRKAGFTPYELNLSGSNAAYRERRFLMQPRTLEREQARLKRIMGEFEHGFRRLHKLGPAVTVFRDGSKVFVPTFAVGRSQQILYHLAVMFHRQLVRPFHVYLDSPMAIEASKTMVKHPDLFSEEMLEWKDRLLPLDPAWFHASVTSRESQSLNKAEGPCLILAGAGMCNGGRILHHFLANIWREKTRVLMVGYQGQGSLGRRLVEGAKSVSIYGEKVTVRATVHTLNGFSAHAGQSDLLKWFSPLAASSPRVLITHGEDKPRNSLSGAIQ